MATIKDIANRLGISVSAVSKGLNGASDISEELRQAVLDTAVELGYSTKRSRKEEHRKLCIFIENMDHTTAGGFGYDIVLGFRQNAFRQKWDVDVIPVTPEFQKQDKYDIYMLRNGYCGALFLGFALQDPWMQQLQNTTMPTVLLDNYIRKNPHVCYIGTDNNEAIDLAIDHLTLLGHKKIALLNGSPHSMVSEERHAAFRMSLENHNLEVDEDLMVYGHYVPETAQYHVPGFLKKGATAIICGNDLIASGVYAECKRLGYDVPNDVSVIGFDDLPIASILEPPLSTLRQERSELGKFAYDSLNALINHIRIGRTMLRPQLVVRESTGRIHK